jgi:hypothetical protein
MFKKILISLILLVFSCGLVGASPVPLDIPLEATCRISAGRNMGSGTVIQFKDGYYYVLTNAHVVGDTKSVKLEFFKDGAKTHPIPGSVVWARRSNRTPIDFAIITVKDDYFGNYPPSIIPLVPANYTLGKMDYVVSSGCPSGTWAVVWEGFVVDSSKDKVLFHPPPVGGQSGSGLFCLYKNGDKLEFRTAAVVTWRLIRPDHAKDSKGFEIAKGGAIPIQQLYHALNGKGSSTEIPSYYEEIATRTQWAFASDGKCYPVEYLPNGITECTVPSGVSILDWNVDTSDLAGLRDRLFPPKDGPRQQPQSPNELPEPTPPPNSPYDIPNIPDAPKDTEKEDLRNQIENLEQQKQELLQNIEAYQNNVKALEQEKEQLRELLQSIQSKVDLLQDKVEEANQKVEAAKLKSTNQLKQTQFEAQKLKDELDASQTQLINLRGQIDQKSSQIIDLQANLHNSQTELEQLTTQEIQNSEKISNVEEQRNWLGGIASILGLGGLSLLGYKLFKKARPSIKKGMDIIEDGVQEAATPLLGEDVVAKLRTWIDDLETTIGDVIEKKLGNSQVADETPKEPIVEDKPTPPVLPPIQDKIPIDIRPNEGITSNDLQKMLNELESKLEQKIDTKIPKLPEIPEKEVEVATPNKDLQPNKTLVSYARELFTLKASEGESIQDWAAFATLYREATKQLRQGQLYFSDGSSLQGQKKTADAIDDWVSSEFFTRTSKQDLVGDKLYCEAMIGFLYKEAVENLRMGKFNLLGAQATADAIDKWVRQEFLRRRGIRV